MVLVLLRVNTLSKRNDAYIFIRETLYWDVKPAIATFIPEAQRSNSHLCSDH